MWGRFPTFPTCRAVFRENLLRRPHLSEPGTQSFRKTSFNFRCDQTDRIHVLDMDFVFQPETGELHADEVGNWGNEDALPRQYRVGDRNSFQVIGTHFFAHKHDVDRTRSARTLRIDEHIYTRDVTEPESERLNHGTNSVDILARNGHVYISRQTSSDRVYFIDMQEYR